jgi:hypothetical protein
MSDFTLTPDDQQSALWRRLRTHLQDQLDACRLRNDAPLSLEQTAALRGQITALKAILNLSAAGETQD